MMPGPNLSGPTSATAEPLERVGLRKGITPPKVKCRYVSIGCCCMARTYGQQFDLFERGASRWRPFSREFDRLTLPVMAALSVEQLKAGIRSKHRNLSGQLTKDRSAYCGKMFIG